MAKRVSETGTTGKSKRTPGKHGAMNAVIGQQFGILQRLDARETVAGKIGYRPDRVMAFDLCAGDGRYTHGEEFHRNTSPGIFAYHAQYHSALPTALPVQVHLYEVKYPTFCDLKTFMIEHLPQMHELKPAIRCPAPYVKASVSQEHITFKAGDRVEVTLHHGSAAEADLSDADAYTAVVVSHDPNTMGGTWPLTPEFLVQLKGKTALATLINTMGCNPGGLMMSPLDVRLAWRERVRQVDESVWSRHDTLVTAIEDDSQKWGYMFTVPTAFRYDGSTLKSVTGAFSKVGYLLETAWLRDDPGRAWQILDRLFLREAERGTV